MGDPLLIAIRFALYADLMLVAGLAAFPLYALTRAERATPALTGSIWRAQKWLYALGLLVSTLGMAALAASMQGIGLFELDLQGIADIVGQTDAGTAWIYRSLALLAGLAASIWLARWPGFAFAVLGAAGAVAIATLAWAGHAGATEGVAGTVHRVSDIVHMLAAAVWIGAIAAFLLLLGTARSALPAEQTAVAARTLDQFSLVGTICVVVIAATGLVNSQIIIGIDNVERSIAAPYGQMLLAKLALFAAMLGLAAANRWRLAPALAAILEPSEDSDEASPAATLAAMRRSLAIEVTAALAILALVAWFGTLEPIPGEMM